MNNFEYASPDTVESAVQLLGPDSLVLAGGTDLLSLMKDGVTAPNRLVNIKEIQNLKGIESTDSGVRIGALVTVEEVLGSPVIRDQFPALLQAADGIRSPQIESRGTFAGDLCQRPRCWYYRRGYGLLAMHDGESMVPTGENRYHAIFGNSGPAYFVNPSSFAPALIALDAAVQIQGPSGSREVAAADFFQIPQSESEKEYDLADNEIVTGVLIPSSGTQNATYEIREKEALDWPLVTASVALAMQGDTVQTAHVVLGHVAPIPWPAEAGGASLQGKQVTAETAEAAGAAAVEGATPLSRNRYKVRLAQVAAKRAILRAAGKEV